MEQAASLTVCRKHRRHENIEDMSVSSPREGGEWFPNTWTRRTLTLDNSEVIPRKKMEFPHLNKFPWWVLMWCRLKSILSSLTVLYETKLLLIETYQGGRQVVSYFGFQATRETSSFLRVNFGPADPKSRITETSRICHGHSRHGFYQFWPW